MDFSNIAAWFTRGTRQTELQRTREAWRDTEALWTASPLGQVSTQDRVWDFVKRLLDEGDRMPAWQVALPILEATSQVLVAEDVIALVPEWDEIENDVGVAIRFRAMLARRRRYAAEYERLNGALTAALAEPYRNYLRHLPKACFGEWNDAGTALEVPLIEMVEDPAEVIESFFRIAYDDRAVDLGLFEALRARCTANLIHASGLAPNVDPKEQAHRLVLPTRQKGKSAAELVDLYLGGTPFVELLEVPIPLQIPDHVRFEHMHIVGGTGHGKTQFLQRLIHADLLAAQTDGRSVVVIDSQGDLISKLVRLEIFDPGYPASLADRLVLVDPADIEFPAALNLFDAHLERLAAYRPVDQERVLNGVVELYEIFFSDLLGAELTQKQGVVFRYLARLMVTIPGATIHTLMQLMDDGHPFRPVMAKLDGSARYFFETEFFHPSFAATKKQILRRLWGVLSTPAFERMFAQSKNKLDLYEATRDGKIVLISTAKDLLKRDGSSLLGRFFINHLAQAALERTVLPEAKRTPTFVYVDEAHEYFDEGVEGILQQARKFGIGLIAAHQNLDQASARLRSAIFSNTSFKCAGGVSAKDARALSDELHTTPEFIEGMKRTRDRTEFAAWVKHWTPSAVRLTVPLGYLERQPTLSEEAYDELLSRNRIRYCGTLAEARQAFKATPQPVKEAAEPTARSEPSPREPDVSSEFVEMAPAAPPQKAAERELGKGGKKHRYLQNLVKGLAEQHGFRSTIEAPIAGGQVDVLLQRSNLSIAVEVSVSTPVEWERRNLRKCLENDVDQVVLVLAKSVATSGRYRAAVVEGLSNEAMSRLTILHPNEVPGFLGSLGSPSTVDPMVKGYRVRVSQIAVSDAEAKLRRDALAGIVSQAMRRRPD